ncbi:hypothetical protein JOQ06_029121 [Pogonophryne albipinna]|uniref:Uncharacterized protein n=1 Tax=Pogonophryne albipinna TaxID=1090488 RepID=A0AAD6BA89_9TELE|nr:hypothetical protein JOQ06_029121 [Pogonophryne albipinna]
MSTTQVASPKDSSWKRMSPSLQCGSGQLKFRAVEPGASQFAVEQGNAPPMPLSQVPSTCGYSMQRNSHALVMLVPYDGCNIVQEGGSYVLPMRWQGIPLSLWLDEPNTSGQSQRLIMEELSPSLQCGSGQLKFRAVGSGASQFAVEQGNAPPMPLSQHAEELHALEMWFPMMAATWFKRVEVMYSRCVGKEFHSLSASTIYALLSSLPMTPPYPQYPATPATTVKPDPPPTPAPHSPFHPHVHLPIPMLPPFPPPRYHT